jgi:putative photosynthetic complex assembly protein
MTAPIRKPVSILFGFLALILLLVGLARFAGLSTHVQDAPVSWQRELLFADAPGGQIAVLDYASQREVAHLMGEQGFLRGVLRALARERKKRNVGPELPFVLSAHTDGRLTLSDPSTGQRIDLESFGPENAAIFSQFKQP